MELFPMTCCGVFIMPLDAVQPSGRQVRPITGRFVLIIFIAFFGVIFAVNGVMMTLAIRTMPGLDVKNGYVASQVMNGELAAMRQQTERGWKADIIVRQSNGAASVSFRLSDRDGTTVNGLDAKARLAHPALTRADHIAAMIEVAPGHYVAQWPDVSPGAWTIVVEAGRGGERLFATRNRIVLSEGRP
jgi:nitrogen fixation protein FixH